ncbi:excinuclease ABC subunit UvrB [Mycoplasma iguanae]|uniref:UvrABC system protein B n=1 Tax=Mycoplasma iguanae TaxID=292461 RepID=A0ABY5RAE7_9MOLU|nr:excinuclease ABC subunit UvrB [Mycoplasma iguanae]UVD81585.1 excinuclease ABC subunit UvrB [Mycoplasma iguanae]
MYKLVSNYHPSGDQPKAIEQLVKGINEKKQHQVLLGVTGSGKTFTIANVIAQTNRSVLVLSHNKTLASQLYSELKEFFPENKVEYFVSNFDYYRPEAYLPRKDVYVEKTSKTNMDLEAMRMSSLNSLLSYPNTIVVSSVAAIYGALNPAEYRDNFYHIETGMVINRQEFFLSLTKINYQRNDIDLVPGTFGAKGDVVEIAPGWTAEYILRIEFFGDEIESISKIEPLTKNVIKRYKNYLIYPASAYTAKQTTMEKAIKTIYEELVERLDQFQKEGKLLEKQRLEERTKNDIDSIQEFGFCSGIENYSRHMDGRQKGERPYTLLDYLPKDALIIIDESHITIPQIGGMYAGDYSRKKNLVDYGFRLPSALDNRPLTFEEFEKFDFQRIYISATPADFELDKTAGEIVSQIIRPTGLLDPIIEIHPTLNQFENIFDRLQEQKQKKERTLILTSTKRVAEELAKALQEKNQKVAYIHSEHKTFERNEILRKLRKGIHDAVIGINLLREGIDLPEVSLILVLDADKEGFLRSKKSLIQIAGRAARNDHGKVIFYADKITKAMQDAIDDNQYKRKIQQEYNEKHHIIPQTIIKPIAEPIQGHDITNSVNFFLESGKAKKKNKKEFEKLLDSLRKQMNEAAKNKEFERAIELRDTIIELEVENS